MKIGKVLHDAIFEESQSQPEPESEPQPQPQRTSGIPGIPGIPATIIHTVPSVVTSLPESDSITDSDSSMNATFLTKLRGKFSSSPLNSVLDQFNATMESLAEAIPEEGNRFRAALKVLAKQSGVTPEQLTDAYNSLLSILETETAKFSKQVEQLKVNEVDTRDKQVQAINGQIESKNKEIQGLMEQRDGIAADIVTAKRHQALLVASFEGVVASLRSEVGDSLQKMKIYFPSTVAAMAKK